MTEERWRIEKDFEIKDEEEKRKRIFAPLALSILQLLSRRRRSID